MIVIVIFVVTQLNAGLSHRLLDVFVGHDGARRALRAHLRRARPLLQHHFLLLLLLVGRRERIVKSAHSQIKVGGLQEVDLVSPPCNVSFVEDGNVGRANGARGSLYDAGGIVLAANVAKLPVAGSQLLGKAVSIAHGCLHVAIFAFGIIFCAR